MGDHNSGRDSDTGELLRQRREINQILVSSICVAGEMKEPYLHMGFP